MHMYNYIYIYCVYVCVSVFEHHILCCVFHIVEIISLQNVLQ